MGAPTPGGAEHPAQRSGGWAEHELLAVLPAISLDAR